MPSLRNTRAIRAFSRVLIVLLQLLAVPSTLPAQDTAIFKRLGDLPGGTTSSSATGISGDGQVVIGTTPDASGPQSCRWTAAGGWQIINLSAPITGLATREVSFDGSVVVGLGSSDSGWRAIRWSGGVTQDLGNIPGGAPPNWAEAVSADGSVVAGVASNAAGYYTAFRWENGSMQSLGNIPGGDSSPAYGISNDGNAVVGRDRIYLNPQTPVSRAFIWTPGGGMQSVPPPVGFDQSAFNAVSGDGQTMLGYVSVTFGITSAAKWTSAGGWEILSGAIGSGFAVDATYDGRTIVGNMGGAAFIWDSASGTRYLKDVLENDHHVDLTGWNLYSVAGISDDGFVLAGTGVNPSGQSEAWLVQLPVRVTRPDSGAILSVAVPDTVRWRGRQKNGWEIAYSLDGGVLFTKLDTILPAAAREFVWTPPDTLRSSDHAIVRVVDALDTSYDGESKVFKLRAWDLVDVAPDGAYEVFSSFLDVWRFPNSDTASIWPAAWWSTRCDYQNGIDPFTTEAYPQAISAFRTTPPSDYPSWTSFVGAFGRSACYNGFPLNVLFAYDGTATAHWEHGSIPYIGSCYGLGVSSLLLFLYEDAVRTKFPGLPPTDILGSVQMDTTIRDLIAQYYISQDGRDQIDHRRNSVNGSPKEVFYRLRSAFLSNDPAQNTVLNMVYTGPGGGGHSVLPYHVRSDSANTQRVRIYVYDSNNPRSANTFILVDTVQDTWKEFGFGWPAVGTGLYLDLPITRFLNPPLLPGIVPGQAPGLAGAGGTKADRDASPATPYLRTYNSPDADITIVSGAGGAIGYRNGQVVDSLAGGIPVIPLVGVPHPPDGYYIPGGEYRATLSGFKSPVSRFAVFDSGAVYTFRRSDADSVETDVLIIGGGFGIAPADDSTKEIMLSAMTVLDSSELEYSIGAMIGPGDSIHLTGNPDGSLSMFVAQGPGVIAELGIRRYSSAGLKTFSHAVVPVTPGSISRLLPADDSLTSVTMLIDVDADGSIDDTVSLDNALTDIRGSGPLSVPDRYALSRNFPNPFNPSTTIEYSLPERAFVTIKVYDVLGREVSTLVDGVEEAGSRRVVFDAANRPAGVYYVRMTAGDFSATQEMLLVK